MYRGDHNFCVRGIPLRARQRIGGTGVEIGFAMWVLGASNLLIGKKNLYGFKH